MLYRILLVILLTLLFTSAKASRVYTIGVGVKFGPTNNIGMFVGYRNNSTDFMLGNWKSDTRLSIGYTLASNTEYHHSSSVDYTPGVAVSLRDGKVGLFNRLDLSERYSGNNYATLGLVHYGVISGDTFGILGYQHVSMSNPNTAVSGNSNPPIVANNGPSSNPTKGPNGTPDPNKTPSDPPLHKKDDGGPANKSDDNNTHHIHHTRGDKDGHHHNRKEYHGSNHDSNKGDVDTKHSESPEQ